MIIVRTHEFFYAELIREILHLLHLRKTATSTPLYSHTRGQTCILFFVSLKSWSEQGTLMVAKGDLAGRGEVEALLQQRVSMPVFIEK